jgi:hypothetical protein
VEFDNGAMFAGRAQAGYQTFRPLRADLPGYSGLVAMGALETAVLDLTRIQIQGGRDVQYSYDAFQPYYLETSVTFKVTQRIAGPFEAIALGERWHLRYQRVGGDGSFDGRQEDTTSIGGGIGVRVGEQMGLTFTVEQMERTSSEPIGRDFQRRRVFASVSYGL